MNKRIFCYLVVLLLVCIPLKVNALLEGQIDYSVPIDYSKLEESELAAAANQCYVKAINMGDSAEGKFNRESAKRYYQLLTDMYPENISYCLKLAIIHDISGEDRYAIGYYSKALNLKRKQAYPFYAFGNFYYKRELYRKALKYYKKSYEYGFSNHYYTLKNMAVIYEKLGDTRASLRFYNMLLELTPNDEDLQEKIRLLEDINTKNLLYYQNSRIHFSDK